MRVQCYKTSDFRNKKYQIATRIYREGSRVWVEKESLFPEGAPHVCGFMERMEILERLYQGTCAVAPCEMEGNVARFSYIDGQTLTDRLLSRIASDRSPGAVAKVLSEWFDVIRAGKDNSCPFVKTQEFVHWFGDVAGLEGAPSLKVCNFDCGCDNLILRDDALTMIDYEWVFTFPIPTDLIFYRLLKLFYHDHPQMEEVISFPNLMQECRIRTGIDLLERMTAHFYHAIDLDPQTGISARQMVRQFKEQTDTCNAARNRYCFVFFDMGAGFSGEQKSEIPYTVQKDGVRLCILLPQGCKAVRLDPIEGFYCLIKSLRVNSDNGVCTITPLNGRRAGDVIRFDNTAPQISVAPPEGAHMLEVTAAIYPAEEEIWKQALQDTDDMQRENARLQESLECTLAEKEAMEAEKDGLARKAGEQIGLSQGEAHIRSGQYSTIGNSLPWRMMAPLRKTQDVIKRTRLGSLTYKGMRYFRKHGFRLTAIAVFARLKSKRATHRLVTFTKPATSFANLTSTVTKEPNAKVYLKNVLKSYDSAKGRKILVISHELNLTGGPVAAMRMAECLKESGYLLAVVSPHNGPLSRDLESLHIPVLVLPRLYTSDVIRLFGGLFDAVVANTIVSAPAVNALYGFSLPVLWWIHEAEESYHYKALQDIPQFPGDNVHVYAGGHYAKERFLSHSPGWNVKELLYYVPDLPEHVSEYTLPEQAHGKVVFSCVAMLEQRKGQNIFVQALESMPRELVCKGYYVFIGRQLYPPCYKSIMRLCERYPENVQYIKELPLDVLLGFYRRIDCLVCSSLDDPMPIVVAEAMAASKLIICSEHTGSAPILRTDRSGLVYYNDDPRELAQCITRVLEHGNEMDSFRSAARSSYEANFSKTVFMHNLLEAMEEMQASITKVLPLGKEREFSGVVSVIIPVYNAGPAMETLLERLFSQNSIPQIEIVAVDSGSTDGTQQLCRNRGAKVIEISQTDFSHSYARNLGAKTARGDILLFMTQDALPIDDYWMRDLIAPILSGEASAVSCREKCPEGTDLYYRISIQNHANFIGIGQSDQLYCLDTKDTPENLRRKGSLSDVSAAIDAQIFNRFGYRFNFAEDLDMGVRLLQAGYSIKLLSSVQTIHGHNRPVGYYLKRAYVESKALENIHVLLGVPRQNAEAVARKIKFGAGILSYALEEALLNRLDTCETDLFIRTLQVYLSDALNGRLVSAYMAAHDASIAWCVQTLEPFGRESRPDEAEIFHHVCYYLDEYVRPYLLEQGITSLNRLEQEEVCGCLSKQFCIGAGRALAGIEPSEPLYESLKVLAEGV